MEKKKLLKGVLELLWVPFLAFDVFLFYDDSTMDLWFAASLWAVFLAASLFIYFYRQHRACECVRLGGLVEAMFVSFAAMFYTVNFFLLALFLWIMNADSTLQLG